MAEQFFNFFFFLKRGRHFGRIYLYHYLCWSSELRIQDRWLKWFFSPKRAVADPGFPRRGHMQETENSYHFF